MSAISDFLASLSTGVYRDPGAAEGVGPEALAPDHENRPTPAELADDSADVAESRRLTQGYVDPTEPARPVIYDEAERPYRGGPSKPLGAPVPVASTSYAFSAPDATSGIPVQIVPASGDRPRRVVIRVGASSDPVHLYTDQRQGPDVGTPAGGGFIVPAGESHETWTQGTVYAAAGNVWNVSVWVDHYPAPVRGRGA